MKKKGFILLASLYIALAWMLSGCGTAPDSKEDPLAAFDVNDFLPFATIAPELLQSTPTPEPTLPSDPTMAPLDWQNDKLPEAEEDIDDDDDIIEATPTKTSSYQDLRKGDESSSVKKLQQRLKELGYYSGSAKGTYDEATVKAVKLFQIAIDMNQTGVATAALQRELFASDAPTYEPTPKPTKAATATPKPEYSQLEYSDSGPEVWRLQERLQKLGYYKGIIDGQFGSGTETAVKNFQRNAGYEPTGVATESVQKLMFSSDAPTAKPTATPTPKPTATQKPTKAPANDEGYVSLSPGATGNRVKQLQTRLKELGYFDGDIGGNYLTKTTAAVEKFQRALGLEETGVATVALQKKLFASDAPRYSATPTATPKPSSGSYSELSSGDSGSGVKRLQERLKELGYYSGSIDGKYGSSTVKAVRAFERAYGRDETGVATAAMQKTLFSKDAKKNTAEATTAPTAAPEENSSDYKKLAYGDTGQRVKNLQKRLKELGYFDGDIGGNFLDKTTAAVKRFQKAIGAEQTGVATVGLQETLFSSSAPRYSESGDSSASKQDDSAYMELRKGDSGSRVENLQYRLKDLGYYTGAVDGEYGDSTVKAVKLFEKAYKKKETGVATEAMQKKLFASDAKAYSGSTSKDLTKGSSGEDVYKLQLRLIELGFLAEGDAEEATFDKATRDAVAAAQKASGYKKTDGVGYAEFVKYLHSDKAYEISQFEYGG